MDRTTEKVACPLFLVLRSGPASMFERSELRSRREERMENGVKNLKGSEAISQNLLVAF